MTISDKRLFLDRLLVAWEKEPQLRLGQIIRNAIKIRQRGLDGDLSNTVEACIVLFYVKDADLIAAIETLINDLS